VSKGVRVNWWVDGLLGCRWISWERQLLEEYAIKSSVHDKGHKINR